MDGFFSAIVFTVHILYRTIPVPSSDVPKKSGKTENIQMHHAELEHGPDAWVSDAVSTKPLHTITDLLKNALQ